MALGDDKDKNVKKGPWGEKKSSKNGSSEKDIWSSQNKNSDDENFEDIEEILRHAQNSLGGMFDGKKNLRQKGSPTDSYKGMIGIFILLATLLWLSSGFYRVLPEENAVVLTFGKWTNTRGEPGLGYTLPYPIQEVRKVNVAFDRRIEIGFRDQGGTTKNSFFSRTPENMKDILSESQMLTGDENIVDIDFVVMWNITDAKNYLFEIRDPEATIKKVAESAMREVIGQSKIQSALTDGRAEIEGKAKALMQKMLDDYKSGVVVNNVQMLNANPPSPVVDAFDDVQRARADKERAKNEGDAYKNDILPKARGEAQKILQGAEAYKEATVNQAKGDAGRFLSVYDAYKQAKDVTKKRLYLETMQEIMSNSKKFIIGSGKDTPMLPYLPLEPAAKKQ